jgi:hypothetical protein
MISYESIRGIISFELQRLHSSPILFAMNPISLRPLSIPRPELADFSLCVEEPREILYRLGTGATMDASADFFVP